MYPGLEQLPDASRDPTVDLPFGQYGLQDQKAIARPRAEDLPRLGSALHPVPCRSNALGVKGVGEAGTTASLAAVMNAVADALPEAAALDLPATPLRVWQVLHVLEDG